MECHAQRCSAGGIASPVLSNIYLDRFDRFVEQQLIPAYDRGRRRRVNPAYEHVENQIAKAKRHGDREALRGLRLERRSLPSRDPNDPGYRRLRYVRYCDLCRARHKSAQGYPSEPTSLRQGVSRQGRLARGRSKLGGWPRFPGGAGRTVFGLERAMSCW